MTSWRTTAVAWMAMASAGCAISQQQEVQLGNDYSAQIASQLPLVKDAQVVRYITQLGEQLAAATDTRGRHSVQQMQQAQGANTGVSLLCTLTKVCDSGTGQAAINLGGSALFAKFSRSDESEADAEAVATTIKAGIDPSGIPGMFRILLSEQQRNPSALQAFFLTHPLAADRVTSPEALIAAYPPSALRGLTKETTAFPAFRRRLLALPPSPAVKTP
ncbi:MAG: M48 family metalloprotease [Gemmatimonadetes bacterium]|nr:M48 family metalloprotease [Gemmatimonadota bacterium]